MWATKHLAQASCTELTLTCINSCQMLDQHEKEWEKEVSLTYWDA